MILSEYIVISSANHPQCDGCHMIGVTFIWMMWMILDDVKGGSSSAANPSGRRNGKKLDRKIKFKKIFLKRFFVVSPAPKREKKLMRCYPSSIIFW